MWVVPGATRRVRANSGEGAGLRGRFRPPLARRCPTLQSYIFSRAPRAAESYTVTVMAIRALLPGYDVDRTPLEELAPLIEGVFYSKQAILAAAAAMPGSTASSTVSVLIKAVQGLRTGGGASNQPGQSSASGGAANAPTGDAFEDGLTGPAYASFQVAMKAADLLSAAGRRGAFEAATAGDCILTVRLLARGEVWLSKKDPTGALGQLYGLRAFLPEWFTYAAAVDANGAITPALAKWSITGTDQNDTAFLDRFLKSDFVMDWMGSYKTPGLLHSQRICRQWLCSIDVPLCAFFLTKLFEPTSSQKYNFGTEGNLGREKF